MNAFGALKLAVAEQLEVAVVNSKFGSEFNECPSGH